MGFTDEVGSCAEGTIEISQTRSVWLNRAQIHVLKGREKCGADVPPSFQDTVRWFVTSARDILLGLNKGSEQALGEYGFNVTYGSNLSTAKTPAKTTPKT